MKSISLAAATAILAAYSAHANLLQISFYGNTICTGSPSDTEDESDSAGNDFETGFCEFLFQPLGTEYFGGKITACDHPQCECGLYTDLNCQNELAIINYDQRKSEQFCFTQIHSVQAYKCWYPPNV